MKKGQLTMEYLIVLTVLVILFTSISTELMEFSSQETLQVQTEQISEIHGSTLINNAESIELQAPGARKSLTITTPPQCSYQIDPQEITLICAGGTPSEEYTGRKIGEIGYLDGVQYQIGSIPEGTTGEITIEKTQ